MSKITDRLEAGHHLLQAFERWYVHRRESPLQQLHTRAGGGVFAKLDGIKGGVECKVSPSVKDVILAPLGGEDVFSGGKMEAKGSVVVGNHHFQAL